MQIFKTASVPIPDNVDEILEFEAPNGAALLAISSEDNRTIYLTFAVMPNQPMSTLRFIVSRHDDMILTNIPGVEYRYIGDLMTAIVFGGDGLTVADHLFIWQKISKSQIVTAQFSK